MNIALNKIIVTISDLRLFALQIEGMHPYEHKNKTKSEKKGDIRKK